LFEQLDQPHQAGREVGVTKSHRKKGRLHCVPYSAAAHQHKRDLTQTIWMKDFFRTLKILGPDRDLSLTGITTSHSSGARLYILMYTTPSLHILDAHFHRTFLS
jgi:hypothetical protein